MSRYTSDFQSLPALPFDVANVDVYGIFVLRTLHKTITDITQPLVPSLAKSFLKIAHHFKATLRYQDGKAQLFRTDITWYLGLFACFLGSFS